MDLPAWLWQAKRGRWITWLPPVVGMPMDDFLSEHAKSVVRGQSRIAKWRSLGAERVFVILTNNDPRMNAMWFRRSQVANALASADVSGVLGPAFSIYLGEEPIAHRFNTARSLRFWEMLVERGIPTAPGIGFTSIRDARLLGEWAQSVGLRSVFFDLQRTRTSDALAAARACLPAFLEQVPRLESIVVNGLFRPNRIQQYQAILRESSGARLTFTSITPHQHAVMGQEFYRESDRYRLRTSIASRSKIFLRMNRLAESAVAGRTTRYRASAQAQKSKSSSPPSRKSSGSPSPA